MDWVPSRVLEKHADKSEGGGKYDNKKYTHRKKKRVLKFAFSIFATPFLEGI